MLKKRTVHPIYLEACDFMMEKGYYYSGIGREITAIPQLGIYPSYGYDEPRVGVGMQR